PEELAGEEDRALLVEGPDPGRAVEGDHALPHVLPPHAREGGAIDRGLLRHVEEGQAEVVDGLVAEHGLRESLVRVVARGADGVDVGREELGGEDAVRLELLRARDVGRGVGEPAQRRVVGPVVAAPPLVEVVERELEPEGCDRVVADAHLAVVDRVARVVALLEEARVVHERRAHAHTLVRPRVDDDARGAAHAADEDAVDRVGERVQEGQAHGRGRKACLAGYQSPGFQSPIASVTRIAAAATRRAASASRRAERDAGGAGTRSYTRGPNSGKRALAWPRGDARRPLVA